MLPLTKQERLVIALISLVLLAGMSLRFFCSRFAFLSNFVNQVAEGDLYPRVDVNHAGREELVNLPYVGEKAAVAIIDHRSKNGLFKSVEEVREVEGLRNDTFQKIKKYLIVRN